MPVHQPIGDCYVLEDSDTGKPFKLDPARGLFVLQAESRAMPPDWQLLPLRDPLSSAFGMATMMLLAELAARDPAMRVRLEEAGVPIGS